MRIPNPNGMPAVCSAAVVNAPRPTNPNWPSDNWPAQPVSTVRESATSANNNIRL